MKPSQILAVLATSVITVSGAPVALDDAYLKGLFNPIIWNLAQNLTCYSS